MKPERLTDRLHLAWCLVRGHELYLAEVPDAYELHDVQVHLDGDDANLVEVASQQLELACLRCDGPDDATAPLADVERR